jgi:hypothetical protein
MAGKEDRLSFCKIPTTESDREATCGLKGPCYSLTRSLREIRLEGSPELLSKKYCGFLDRPAGRTPKLIERTCFMLSFSGVTAATTVTAATFSFGIGPDFFIPRVPVPGPIVGAGLPGLVAACAGLLVLARRRRKLVV